ncbi:hypothetical protein FHT00_002165 [Sphingomonas insulae]|nr:hypothetical protein [Sphingomonas insulae]
MHRLPILATRFRAGGCGARFQPRRSVNFDNFRDLTR